MSQWSTFWLRNPLLSTACNLSSGCFRRPTRWPASPISAKQVSPRSMSLRSCSEHPAAIFRRGRTLSLHSVDPRPLLARLRSKRPRRPAGAGSRRAVYQLRLFGQRGAFPQQLSPEPRRTAFGVPALVELRDSLPAEQRPVIQVSFSSVFGCSLEGRVDPAQTIRYADEFMKGRSR